jgi:hypothetical protein
MTMCPLNHLCNPGVSATLRAGFEQEMFKARNDRKTRNQEAWKYTQSLE